MKVLIQTVNSAKVIINNKTTAQINKGLLLFVGIHQSDNFLMVKKIVEKIVKLRIFENQENKFDLSVKQLNGEILVVSQFTLYANCDNGRRPEFFDAMSPDLAQKIYQNFFAEFINLGLVTKQGVFGAKMKVISENNGPATFIIEKLNKS